MPNSVDPRERPQPAPADKLEEGVAETFPASDPVANTATQGARAVPPEKLMQRAAPPADSVVLTRRFGDAEAAKLALEQLVRSAPLDRDCTRIEGGTELHLRVPRQDASRIEAMLRSA